jgi:hypothetical protein
MKMVSKSQIVKKNCHFCRNLEVFNKDIDLSMNVFIRLNISFLLDSEMKGATTPRKITLSVTTISITIKVWHKHNETWFLNWESLCSLSFIPSINKVHKVDYECRGWTLSLCRFANSYKTLFRVISYIVQSSKMFRGGH